MVRLQDLLLLLAGCLLDSGHGMVPHSRTRKQQRSRSKSFSSSSSPLSPPLKDDSWPHRAPLYQIPRIAKDEFHPFRKYYSSFEEDCGRPILIEGVLSEAECEVCCEQLLSAADQLPVDLQQQRHIENRGTQIFPCTLSQAINVIMRKSDSQIAYLAFCEGLLSQPPEGEDAPESQLRELQNKVNQAKNSLFENDNDEDWFQWFPSDAQPTDAVILAGAGATSTLHRDPMEWTGTSLCLEGSKVWRFLEPPKNGHVQEQRVLALDEALDCYRLASIAWQGDHDGETVSLSSGWQSDFSLYYHRDHAAIPSAQSIADMDDDKRQALLETLSLDWKVLSPNLPQDVTPSIHTVIQKAGDLLLIPAHWWHQTYGFEPSVAIASQRCGTMDAERVFQHILSQKTGPASPLTARSILDTSQGPAEAVSKLFQQLR